MRDLIGRTLGHYRIVEKIGEGGMGVVYLAHDERLDRDVAVKVLPEDVAQNSDRLARFEREAKVIARLSHPNILDIHDYGHEGEVTYSVTELLEGETLRERLEGGTLGWHKATEIGAAVADGLAAAHQAGIVHRDLKPSNVFLTTDGRVKVLDFGLARHEAMDTEKSETHAPTVTRHTDPGTVLGTVGYMSPEQVKGETVDGRSDIFSLGCVIYEMVSGQRAFARDTAVETMSAILKEEPAEISSAGDAPPPELAGTIRRCLEKQAESRFQSASDLAYNLRTISSTSMQSVIQPAARSGRWRRAAPRLLAVVGVAAALAIALWAPWREPPVKQPVADASGKMSVAVLLFDNLVVTELSQSEQIQVLSTDRIYQILEQLNRLDDRITSFEVVREVADRAGVGTVLLGSVAKVGEQIRISIKIQEAATGSILGAKRVDGIGQENLFAMVDELGVEIRQSLELEEASTDGLVPSFEDVATSSFEAFRSYSEALQLMREAKNEEAIPLFQQAVDIDPNFALAWRGLGAALDNSFLVEQSERAIERAFELRDRLTGEDRLVVEAEHYSDRWETAPEALAAYSKLREITPRWNNNYGILLNQLERYEEAIEVFEEAIARDSPPGYWPYANLADSYVGLAEFDDARQTLEGFLLQEPNHHMVHLTLGHVFMDWGRLDDAQRAFEIADSLRPGDFRILWALSVLAVLRDEWDEATAIAAPLLESASPISQRVGRYIRVTVLEHRGHFIEAARLIEQNITSNPDPRTRSVDHIELATLNLEFNRLELALDHTERSFETAANASFNRALSVSALALMRLGDAAGAHEKADVLKERAERLPSDREIRRWHLLQGELALEEGDIDRAVFALEEARSLLPPGSKGALSGSRVSVLRALATAYIAAGEDAKAEDVLDEILNAGSERLMLPKIWVRSHYLLAQIHERRGDTEKARELYRRFHELWRDGDIDRERVEEAKRKSGM
jgi:serine/threonine protein kinase/Tfp pilus assembly protein PilF